MATEDDFVGDLVDIKLRIFGGFVYKTRNGVEYLVYEAGFTYWKREVPLRWVTVGYLRYLCAQGIDDMGWEVPNIYVLWFKEKGKTWMTGKRKLETVEDLRGLIEAKHRDGYLEVFCTVSDDPSPSQDPQSTLVEDNNPNPNIINSSSNPNSNTTSNPNSKSSSAHILTGSKPSQKKPRQRQISSLSKPISPQTQENPNTKRRSPRFTQFPEIQETVKESLVRRSPRFSALSVVDRGECKLTEAAGSSALTVQDPGARKGTGKGTGKASKARRVLNLDDDEASGSGSSSSDESDLDIDWAPGEEEGDSGDDEDERLGVGCLLSEVNRSLGIVPHGEEESKELALEREERLNQLVKDLGCEEPDLKDEGSDEDELRSLHGSDEDEDNSPWFHEDIDFQKPIVLVNKLQFTNNTVLRKALRVHAIENRYEYYYLHNGGDRITTYCKKRCNCLWTSKRSKLPGECNCGPRVKKCPFKVLARRLHNSTDWQIKELNLNHKCMRSKMNSKVNAEFIAERYVEEWRHNPDWKIKSLQARVLSDLGISVSYSKGWLARARAKLKIYGSSAEQYARVYDYRKAVIKYSPGSGVCVVVDGDANSPERPLFMRMYICLQPLRSGFIKGCRPLLGVDGCHLKGSYPGQILVAVGKDGNNNIYPVAWATVEVENKETWCWFLNCLKKDIGDVADGAGWTYMSDRQKGLLEAFELAVPLADKRYCVRHIWANFKLQFTGSTFKELFWNAARATTAIDFEIAMESIRFLSEDAYVYLDNIPPRHWSRHAFPSQCKSNMLLNNICETFNAVIRDARDKPIVTQMEWLRRYVMKRHNDKWEAVQKLDGKLMPYVSKKFHKIERVARHCIVQVSRGDSYEVELNGDSVLVDLEMRSCTCYHWQLTGIPCVHGFACLMDKRVDPEDFVDMYYHRQTYMYAYEEPVKPMPGPKHWEKQGFREPLPPAIRVMPGRPKSKKRKKERGEGEADRPAKSQKNQKKCSNCGQVGHYAKTCASKTKCTPKGPATKPVLNDPWNIEQRRKKELRAASKTGGTPGPNSIATKNPKKPATITKHTTSQDNAACTQASQASTTAALPKQQTSHKGKGKQKKN